jgi:hypothetical protein
MTRKIIVEISLRKLFLGLLFVVLASHVVFELAFTPVSKNVANNNKPHCHISNSETLPVTSASFLTAARNARLIFVGGSQRSGTSLMRALLDVHDSVKCGVEVCMLRQ